MAIRRVTRETLATAIVRCAYAIIPAIKAYRAITGVGLREAKIAIQAVPDYQTIFEANQDSAASYARTRPERIRSISNA